MKWWSVGIVLLFLACVTTRAESVKPPPKEKLKLFLLMGQSNMAGRAAVEKEDLTLHPRVFVFTRSNQWEVAIEPINRFEPNRTPGVGPSLAFGKAMADADTNIYIGLSPALSAEHR